MSVTIPTAPAPINATTVHVATPPTFQSGAGGVSVATQQSVTVSGSAIFGGQLSVNTPPSAASASIVPPALPPLSVVEPLFGTLALNVPMLATNQTITVMTFSSEQGQFTKVTPLVSGEGPPLPPGTSRFEFITFNDSTGGAFDPQTVPQPNS